MSNEKTQPIQWTKQPTGALVATGSIWLHLGTSVARNPSFFKP